MEIRENRLDQAFRDTSEVANLILENFQICISRDSKTAFLEGIKVIYELVCENRPVPLLSLIFDFFQLLQNNDSQAFLSKRGQPQPSARIRIYEDRIIGKFLMDPLLERASEAIFGQPEDKIPAAAAFLLHRIQERLNLPAVNISAGIIRGLLDQYEVALPEIGEPEQLPGEPSDVSKLLFDKTLEIFRSCDSFLNSADLQALEQKTALMPLAKYLAHRQIVENSLFFQQLEIKSPPLATRTRRVSSNIRNEDQYPIGGYSSISNKGTFESLLHSQLAYMSPDRSEKPDTFDLKFLREELFYYSRDENIFLRQRRKFIFVFAEDLKNARLKDDGAPVQRLILALALVDAILQKLTERLAQDALHFHLLFLRSEEPLELQPERELLQILQRDGIQRGAVQLEEVAPNLLNEKILNLRKEINCDILLLSYRVELANNELIDENLTLGTPRPILSHTELEPVEDYLENWSNTYQFLMSKWLAQ